MGLGDLLDRHDPRRPALILGADRRSFGELASGARRREGELAAAGIRPGDLVALAEGNSPGFLESCFALWRIGAAVLPVEPSAPVDDVAARMEAGWILRRGTPPLRRDAAARVPAGTALVKLTSGSTLEPRGACFGAAALEAGIRQIGQGMSIGADDRLLVAIPLSHSYGFDHGVLALGVLGATLVLHADPLPAAMLRALGEHAITFLPTVPAVARAMAEGAPRALPALRAAISASAPLGDDTAAAFRARFGIPVRQFYGCSECGGIAYESAPDEPGAPGTVGRPLPGVRIEIAGGQVRVHSAAARSAAWNGRASAVEPWVEPGDRGELAPDGRVRLLGRSALVANIAGFKVDLAQLEEFLRAQPGVTEAAALPVHDPARGDRVVAWVESASRSAESLVEACRAGLSAREAPRELHVVARLPRTERGKVDRRALAAGGEAAGA